MTGEPTNSRDGRILELHFTDKRPPSLLVQALESELSVLFSIDSRQECLALCAKGSINGAHHCFELRYEAALPSRHAYFLRIAAAWAHAPASSHDYFLTTSEAWFKLWTQGLQPCEAPPKGKGSRDRYTRVCEEFLQSRRCLESVSSIQQAIVAGLKAGGSFRTAHKEGGSIFAWQGGAFRRTDFGDCPDSRAFAGQEEFLTMLRQFYRVEVDRNVSEAERCELTAWALILRRMTPA